MPDFVVARFAAFEGSGEVLAVFRSFVEAFKLPAETAGTNWGVSVPKDRRGKVIRINARNQQLLAARWNVADGWVCRLMAPRLPYVSEAVERHGLFVEDGQRADPYPHQVILSGTLDEIEAVLSEREFCEAHGDFVGAYATRTLLRPTWTNSAAVSLVLGEKGARQQQTRTTDLATHVGVPYVPAAEQTATRAQLTIFSALGAEEGTRRHIDLQNELAALLTRNGFEPLSPGRTDPPWDVGFRGLGGVLHIVEVKSLTPENEVHQLRLGLGQVLDYRARFDRAIGVLYVERAPVDPRWFDVCGQVGIVLLHPEIVGPWLEHESLGVDVGSSP